MRAALLSVGSELLRGDIVDTNAAFLARELSGIGFQVCRVEQIGDDLEDLTAAFRSAIQRAEVVLCTGGLGPTQDDLTREAIAGAVGEEMYLDDMLVQEIEMRFAAMRRQMPASNIRQAMLIPSATAIPNPNGSAPGWYVRHDRVIVAAMPGPPSEMQPMWRETVRGLLEQLLPGKLCMLALMTFGLGESRVEEQIADLIDRWPDVTIATYAKDAGVQVHLTAQASTEERVYELGREAEAAVRERLGESIFGSGEITLSAAVGELLDRQDRTVAVMESATGGELASMITDHPGSSRHFLGGIVAYSRDVKQAHGVSAEIMDRHGLISAETAHSMARACRDAFGVDAALAVTGIAGAESVEGKAPGTCYIALSLDGVDTVREVRRPGSREISKRFFAQSALDLLRQRLLREEPLDA